MFYDQVERDVPDQFGERRNTFDIDAQQNLSVIGGHSDGVWRRLPCLR